MDKRQLTALASKAIAGDKEAFEELYVEHARSILFHVRSLIVDKENCYDVAQDALYKMYTSIGKLREPAAFRGWMHQVIRTVCADHNKLVRDAAFRMNAGDNEQVLEEMPDQGEGSDPEAAALAALEGNQLFAIINELPDNYREIIVQRYYDDLSYKEIAEIQQISITNVSTRLKRAVAAVRKKMGDKGEESRAQEKGTVMKSDDTQTQMSEEGTAAPLADAQLALSSDSQPVASSSLHPVAPGVSEDASLDFDSGSDEVVSDLDIKGASLKGSLISGMAVLFPDDSVMKFTSTAHEKLFGAGSAAAATGGTAAAASAVTNGAKIVIAVVSVMMAVAIVITSVAVVNTTYHHETTPVSNQSTLVDYQGTAHIAFVDENGGNSDRNIVEAVLIEDVAASVSCTWKLYLHTDGVDPAGEGEEETSEASEYTSGSGYQVDNAVLVSLPPGDYTLVFTLVDENNAIGEARRSFTIVE